MRSRASWSAAIAVRRDKISATRPSCWPRLYTAANIAATAVNTATHEATTEATTAAFMVPPVLHPAATPGNASNQRKEDGTANRDHSRPTGLHRAPLTSQAVWSATPSPSANGCEAAHPAGASFESPP